MADEAPDLKEYLRKYNETAAAQSQEVEEAPPLPPELRGPAPKNEPTQFSEEGVKDVGKGLLSGVAKGVVGVPGIVGDVASLSSYAAPALKYGVGKVREFLDPSAPAGADEAWKEATKAIEEAKTVEEKAGTHSRVMGVDFPTSRGMQEFAKRQGVPGMDYDPSTPGGRILSTVGEFGGSALGFGAPGMIAKGGTKAALKAAISPATLGAGAAAGTAHEILPDSVLAPIVGTFLGAGVGAGVGAGAKYATSAARDIVAPVRGAERRLMDTLRIDAREGTARMTPQQFMAAQEAGQPVTLLDMAGDKTTDLLSRLGARSPKTLQKLNENILGRNEAMRTANADFITRTFNLTEPAGATAEAMRLEQKQINDRLYSLARSNPAAQSIQTPRIAELSEYGPVKRAMADVAEFAADPRMGIVAPTADRGGNLAFWDQVKQNLDDQVDSLYRTGEHNRANIIKGWKNDLLQQLNTVDGYAEARATAAAGFGARNALEAGVKFANKPDTFRTQELLNRIDRFTPEERQLFMQGVGHTLLNKAQNTPGAFTKFVTNREMAERLRAAMGPEMYDQLHGFARATQNMGVANTIAAAITPPGRFSGHYGVLGGIGMSAMELSYLPPDLIPKMIAGWAFDQAVKMARTAAEKRIAPEVGRLIMSTDPADLQRLGRLLQESPEARSLLDSSHAALLRLNAQATQDSQRPRAQRKAGGRIGGLNHGAIAMSLIRAAEKAKKGHNTTTEPLLEQPDEAITKALAIADEALK